MKEAFVIGLSFALFLSLLGVAAHKALPRLLGGDPAIQRDASLYFLVFALSLPLAGLLVARMGLRGAWIAMSAELIFRGSIFLCRLAFHRWEDTMKKSAGN